MDQKISVALCTYNGATFLSRQLDSILNQLLAVQEIIICDDGSTDDTKLILDRYASKYPGIIKVFLNEINLRSVKNFEKAISLTTGDFIFLSDQDDLWYPAKTERMIRYFRENPEAECLFTDALLIDDNDLPIENYTLWQTTMFHPAMIKACGSFWEAYQSYDNMVTGATLGFKKNVKEFIFPFPVAQYFHHDEWIALHCAQRNTLHLLNDTLTGYRIHTGQQVGGGLIERYEREKVYANMLMNVEYPPNFKLHFKVFKNLYASHNKLQILSRTPESSAIDIEGLKAGNLEKFKETAAKLRRRFPLRFTAKRIHDYLRNKRQILK